MTLKNGNSSQVVSAALILGAAGLVSRIVGLFRERVLTTTFGAGDTFDAFVAAFRLPDLIFNVIVVGALSAAFIPLFTEKLVEGKGKKSAHDFASSVLISAVVAVGCFSLVYAIFADKLVPLFTPGFSGQKLETTILLSRIMALQPILLAGSFVVSGVLNSYKRFVAYALAPILYNLGIIFGVWYLVPRWGIAGLGWGVVIGAALHLLIQIPSVLKTGWKFDFTWKWSKKDINTLVTMTVPRALGLAAQQINLFLVAIIGSTLASGSIAVFHLANNLQSVPLGVFGIAFAQAAFPTMAEQVSRNRKSDFKRTLTRTFRYILFLVLPVSVFMWILRAQTVRVLFGAGRFDWEDTILTFETLGWLLISLFAQATVPLLARAFYVRQNTSVPVIVSLISIIVNIALAVYLTPTMGVAGLAVAFSIGAIVNLILLLIVLHWQLGDFEDREVLESMMKIVAAAILAGVVVQGLKYPIAAVVDMQKFWGVSVQLITALVGGVGVYLGLCILFKCEELHVIWHYLPKKWKLNQLPAGVETSRFEGIQD